MRTSRASKCSTTADGGPSTAGQYANEYGQTKQPVQYVNEPGQPRQRVTEHYGRSNLAADFHWARGRPSRLSLFAFGPFSPKA